MKRGALFMVRSAPPTSAGTEARPTNLKLETRNFSEQKPKIFPYMRGTLDIYGIILE
jgi:hypothetical protein